jgi:pimeloyl-ACP methyl ester carboxylesterase
MPSATLDGIETHYEVIGSGPPLLMFSPGGFNAVTDNWSDLGVYRTVRPVEQLAGDYACIVFDRREAGRSGGRVERITWAAYVRQALALLDHLDVDAAHVMGGCVGCSQAAALAIAHPERVRSLILYSPAGGPHYRLLNHARFGAHLAYVREQLPAGVVALAREVTEGFSKDPRVGPWVSVIRRDDRFASGFEQFDVDDYALLVAGMVRGLFDRDTVPGAEPEDLLRLRIPALVVPGQDRSHATSAARYLEECIPGAEYWDVPVPAQTSEATSERLRTFLAQT